MGVILDELQKYEIIERVTGIDPGVLTELKELTMNIILIFSAIGTGVSIMYAALRRKPKN